MRWVLGYAAALCVLVLIISQSVIIPTFFMPFFNWHYNRAETAAELGMTHDDLMRVTKELLDYMRGRTDDMSQITARAEGFREYGEAFYSPTEIRHMYDVKDIYEKIFTIRRVAFLLLIALVLAMFLLNENPLFLLSRCSREIVAGFFSLMVIATIIISFDFSHSWDIFHHIFFRGDAANYWRLTPYVDLMINMYPLNFFIGISIFAASLATVFSAIVVTVSTLYLRYNRRPTRFSKP
jgi:integral membrane protein (TIGR01906 family)